MLANASMPTSAEGKVGGCGALANETVAVVDLFLVLINLLAKDRGRVGRVLLPSVRIPDLGVGEVLGVVAGNTGGREKSVARWDDVFSSRYGHGALDGPHDGVDRGVHAERLLDDGLAERELRQVLVLDRRQVST